jgi:uncharacterized protein
MFQRLLSTDRQVFEQFAELASRLPAAARLLRRLFAEPAALGRHAAAIEALEHQADRIVREINVQLDTALITPIDREDVHLLASRLDDVVDLIDDAARRAVAFRIAEAREPVTRLADVLVRAGEALEAAVAHVRNSRLVLARSREVRQLEKEGDAVYAAAVSELFAGRPDPIELLKWKELYDCLEQAVDECAHAAAVLESISLKHA